MLGSLSLQDSLLNVAVPASQRAQSQMAEDLVGVSPVDLVPRIEYQDPAPDIEFAGLTSGG